MNFKLAYAASAPITISMAGIASSATVGRQSASIDNAAGYIDVLVQLALKLQAGTPSGDKAIYVYAYGSEGGTLFSGNATGVDAGITLRVPTILRLIGTMATPDSGGLLYTSHPMSVAAAFNGVMPRKWGIVIVNASGVALSVTEGDHTKGFTGVSVTGS